MDPIIKWRKIKNRRCLVVHFEGGLSGEQSQNAAEHILSEVVAPPEPLALVWKTTRMTNCDFNARHNWQGFINKIEPKLSTIHLISDDFHTRIWVATISLFAGIKIHTWADWDQFEKFAYIAQHEGRADSTEAA